MLKVTEIFRSIQGESSYAGLPCAFVRLTGCNLRCGYCDTQYAFHNGTPMSAERIVEVVDGFGIKLAEITGGEPLLQAGVYPLMQALLDKGYRV
ncbi:MAG: radical SAM protein, partial [Nitrospinae bacterium]|nr:radical SAM protein [Nitrospinota bacterium]